MKRIIPFIMAAMLLAACSKPADESAANLQAAKDMFAAFNNHDWKKMASFYADTAEFLDPAFGTDHVKKTQAETAGKYAEMQQLFPDINDDVKEIFAAGDKVTVQFVSSGTPEGAPKWYLPICSVLTFKNGKIVKDATYYDNE